MREIRLLLAGACVLLLPMCDQMEGPLPAGVVQATDTKADALMAEAIRLRAAGKIGKSERRLEQIIMSHGLAPCAPQARFMLGESLEKRGQLLKIMSMNHYDLESSCRPEHLTEFKVAYGKSLHTVMRCLEQYFPEMPISEKQDFLYTFFPFMFGIYPYTVVTEKQRAAMKAAGVNYVFMTIYEITYNCIKGLLSD